MPDIQLMKRDPSTGVLTMGMGRSPKIITGIDLLAQVVALSILKNPGRDVIDPEEGSGLRDAIGQYNLSSPDELKLLVLQRIKQVEKDILSRQAETPSDPSEKLKKLTVVDIAVDSGVGKVLARVRVLNETGASTDILV